MAVQLDNVEDVYPLSAVQSGMLFHSISAPDSGVYIGQICCRWKGKMELQAFKRAWQSILSRHTALRTAFVWNGLDKPLQLVRRDVELEWRLCDLSELSTEERAFRIEQMQANERRKGFDLSSAPLMRMLLIKLAEDLHCLVWTCHHLVLDGWSTSIVLDECRRLYAAQLRGETPRLADSLPYRAYIDWFFSRDTDGEMAFWKAWLAGFTTPNVLRSAKHPDPSETDQLHAHMDLELPPAVGERLAETASKLHLTASSVLHAAWSVLLQRYSNQDDVVFGTGVSGRSAPVTGMEAGVGLFINTLPARIHVTDRQSLSDWLCYVHGRLTQLQRFEFTPVSEIQACSELPPGETLFETMLVVENQVTPAAHEAGAALQLLACDSMDQSNYPLVLLATPAQQWRLRFVFDPGLYREYIITGMLQQLHRLLTSIPEHLHRPVGELPLLSKECEDDLLRLSRGALEPLPGQHTVVQLIERRCIEAGDSAAVLFQQQRISYRELEARSRRVAGYLMSRGVQGGDRVAVCMQRGTELICAILGILRSGAAYVPLDPHYPQARIRFMLADCGADMVLSDRETAALLASLDVEIVDFAKAVDPANRHSSADLPVVRQDQPAYLIYTSGSTAEPKGVLVSHRNLLASTLARQSGYVSQPGVFLLLSPVAFDSSVAAIFWSLITGGELLVAPQRAEQDIHALAGDIRRHGVTHVLCLPAVYELLLRHADSRLLAGLKVVILAGESLPPRLIFTHREKLPECGLFNEYGPTEATVWCSVYDTRVYRETGPVPIGKPIANAHVYVLDSARRLLPPGVTGELYIGGDGLASGYWQRPELNMDRFVDVTLGGVATRLYRSGDLGHYLPDGNLVFLGRTDRQIKLRGYRIEPQEVESVLRQYPQVLDAAVWTTVGQGRTSVLAACVTPCEAQLEELAAEERQLRQFIDEHLPAFMQPRQIHVLKTIPRLPNGKTDFTSLRHLGCGPAQVVSATVAPRNPTEQLLSDIWQDVLQCGSLSVNDNFFRLGGDSIRSIEVVSRAGQKGLSLSPNDLFNFPSIAALAERIVTNTKKQDEALPPADAFSSGPATAFAHRRIPFVMVHAGRLMVEALRSSLETDRPVYVLGATKHWELGELEHDVSVEELAEANLEELRSLQAQGPYCLGGYSMGAPIAFEMARRLRSDGETVELLFLLDPPGQQSVTRRAAKPAARGSRQLEKISLERQSGRSVVAAGRAERYLSRLAGLTLREKVRLVLHKGARRARHYLYNRPRVMFREAVLRPGAARFARIYRGLGLSVPSILRNHYVNTVYLNACRRYQVGDYDGKVVIYHASGNPGDKHKWEGVTSGELEEEWFEGRHMDFLEDQRLLEQWTTKLARMLELHCAQVSTRNPD